MQTKETPLQQCARERWEAHRYTELLAHPSDMGCPPVERVIKISRRHSLYSLRWIVAYATARHAGIACMYLASGFANQMVWDAGELHTIMHRSVDIKLLWRANLYWIEQNNNKRKDRS